MKRIKTIIVLALVFSLASCSMVMDLIGTKARPTTGTATSNTNSGTATLAAYKVATVSATRTDSAGNPLTQPYGSLVSSPLPRKQIYLSGPPYSGATSNLIDYAGNAPTVLFQQTNTIDTAWTAYPHASVGARLGLSGKQTIVSVVFLPTSPKQSTIATGQDTTGTVELITWDGTTQTILTPFSTTGTNGAAQSFDVWLPNWSSYAMNNSAISVAAGDIDGDGKDEIAFCIGNYFVILDDDLSTVLYSKWVTDSGTSDTSTSDFHPSRVIAGDVKNDGNTEFVVTYGNSKASYTGSYKIFAGAVPAPIASGAMTNGSYSLGYANVALGDIDGKGANEVLFAGRQTSGSDSLLIAAAWNGTNLTFLSNAYDIGSVDWGGNNPLPPLVCFNPFGKGNTGIHTLQDLVVFWNKILSYDSTKGFISYANYPTLHDTPDLTNVVAADINYDDQDELIAEDNAGNTVYIYSLNPSSGDITYTSFSITNSSAPQSLCVADMAGKSFTIQYLGHTVQYSNPRIVAVMASPPYYLDAVSDSSYGSAQTSFGSNSSTSTSSSLSFTFSASVSVGFKASIPVEPSVLETEDKVTVSDYVTGGFGSEQSMSYSHSYSVQAGQNTVLYSCVPFDVYSYKVLSAPDSSTVGTTETVDYPRTPQIIQMDQAAFNALPGNKLNVGTAVMSQTLGIPKTYPTLTAIHDTCNASGGMYDPTGMTAPYGPGNTNTDSITSESSNSTTFAGGLKVEASSDNSVAFVVFGASVGLSTDYSSNTTISSSTQISGTVSSIMSSDSPFQYGIAGYNYTNTAIQPSPFMVVTYWVQ